MNHLFYTPKAIVCCVLLDKKKNMPDFYDAIRIARNFVNTTIFLRTEPHWAIYSGQNITLCISMVCIHT